MPFHPHLRPHISRPAASAAWLLRLMVIVLGGLLLWASACAIHDSESHTHGRMPVSSGHSEAVEPEKQHGPHPHPGLACTPYAVGQVLPQARQLPTDAAASAAFPGVAAGVTAAMPFRPQPAWPHNSRSRIRRSGRATLRVVCRWRI